MLYTAFCTRDQPYNILFVYFAVINHKFTLNIYRFVPVRFKHMQMTDDLPIKISHEIKKRLFERQMDYINKAEFKKRNPKCNVS